MSTIRVNKNKDYFSASNKPFNDTRLRWETRGVLAYLLSKPDEWICRNQDLIKQGPAGQKKIDGILKELKEFGYMTRTKYQKTDGTIEWETEIYETPELNPDFDSSTIPPKSRGGEAAIPPLSIDGSSIDGKQGDIISTETINTESNKEDNSSTLFRQFLKISKKRGPKSDVTRDEWFADCDDILDMAGGDIDYAKELMTQARIDCIKAEYSFAKPGGLINWIAGVLERKEVEAAQETKTWHDGYDLEIDVPDQPTTPDDQELQQIRAIAGAQFAFLREAAQGSRENGQLVLEFPAHILPIAQHRHSQVVDRVAGWMAEENIKEIVFDER